MIFSLPRLPLHLPFGTPVAALCLCCLILLPAAPAAARSQAEGKSGGEGPAAISQDEAAVAGDEEEAADDQTETAAPVPAAAPAGAPTYELDAVTVTATRSEREVTTAPASVTIITAEELEKLPVGDVTDAIRDVPGVSLSAGTQGRRGINIRGMGSAYTLILIDGKRVNSGEAVFRHNDFDIGMVPVEAIDRIEVVRGSMSSLYGSEAMGGVINIITKPVAREWTAGLDAKGQTPLGGASGEELRSSVYFSGPLLQDKVGIRLTGAFDQRMPWHGVANPGAPLLDANGKPVQRADGSTVRRGDLATLEGRTDHNGRARLVWTPDRAQTLAAEYGQAYQSREGEFYIRGTANNFTYGEADSTIDRRDFVLSHDGKWDWGLSQVRGYRETISTSPDELFQGNWVLEGNSTFLFESHALTLGAEGRWIELEALDQFTSGKASVYQHAVYAQDEYQLTEQLSLLAGGRLDFHENFGLHGTPRGYLVYSPLKALTLKGGVGTGFRAPTLRQLSDESIVPSCRGECVIIGNPDLEPERSINYELSAAYDLRQWGVSATFFLNDVSNLIDTPRGRGVDPVGQTPDGIPIFVPLNVDKARLQGLESTVRYSPIRVVDIKLNHTFVDSRDVERDVELDNRPRHLLNGQVDWRVGYGVAVFTRAQYIGEQKSGDITLDGYSLFDAGMSYRPMDSFGMSLGLLNLADTRTEMNDGYTYQERGRTLYLGLNARY